MTKPNTFRHNHPASVASLRRLFAFPGTPFGFPLESPFTFTGIPTVQRGVVNNHVGNTKTLARRKPVPLAKEVIAALEEWRKTTPYRADTDWVFASGKKKGKVPYSADSVLKWTVKAAAKRAKVSKRLGWHSLRHSYSTLLRANGTDVKVQSELLRHSNIQTTLNIYTQAMSNQKREANALVVGQLRSEQVAATA